MQIDADDFEKPKRIKIELINSVWVAVKWVAVCVLFLGLPESEIAHYDH